jgi:hypothetical protein
LVLKSWCGWQWLGGGARLFGPHFFFFFFFFFL